MKMKVGQPEDVTKVRLEGKQANKNTARLLTCGEWEIEVVV